MTLQERLKEIQAEMDTAQQMCARRIKEAILAFEAETGLVVEDVRLSANENRPVLISLAEE